MICVVKCKKGILIHRQPQPTHTFRFWCETPRSLAQKCPGCKNENDLLCTWQQDHNIDTRQEHCQIGNTGHCCEGGYSERKQKHILLSAFKDTSRISYQQVQKVLDN